MVTTREIKHQIKNKSRKSITNIYTYQRNSTTTETTLNKKNSNLPETKMAYINGHFALANANMNTNYRPALIDFHGYEGEDFRHFVESLESYFAINNITQEPRKLIILKAQLRGAAKVYYEKEILKRISGINYEQAVDLLKNCYITPELIQSYSRSKNCCKESIFLNFCSVHPATMVQTASVST